MKRWTGSGWEEVERVQKQSEKRGNPRPPGLIDPNKNAPGAELTPRMRQQIDMALNQLLAHTDERYVKAEKQDVVNPKTIVPDAPKDETDKHE